MKNLQHRRQLSGPLAICILNRGQCSEITTRQKHRYEPTLVSLIITRDQLRGATEILWADQNDNGNHKSHLEYWGLSSLSPPLASRWHVLGPRSGGTTGAALGQGLGPFEQGECERAVGSAPVFHLFKYMYLFCLGSIRL